MTVDILMAYPNHNIQFHKYTNASNYQMGTEITQQKFPVLQWTCKLTEIQQNYHTMLIELFYIFMILKKFQSLLLASELFIYTDHKKPNICQS